MTFAEALLQKIEQEELLLSTERNTHEKNIMGNIYVTQAQKKYAATRVQHRSRIIKILKDALRKL